MSVLARLTASLEGRYRIERELGAGGMATVYLAHDIRHDRDVAIKVLHPDLGAALGADRFLSEIKTTAKLQHPHILPLLDSGAAEGLLYYVMPYVRGETLRARLNREQLLPIADAVRLAREIASALDYAHREGVIHRDIKPENILLQDGAAIVADFGIALAVQQAGGARMTQTGLSLGTPHYMSPEQAMGEKQIDARSDVYALAAVTYEMLTGDPPFSGTTVQSIVARVLTEKPVAPSALRETVPAHVEAAVLIGLAKRPPDRPATAKAFSELLDERQAPRLSGADAVAPVHGGSAVARPSTTTRWIIGALTMLVVAATAVAGWLWQRPAPEAFPVYTDLALPDSLVLVSDVMISPDGRYLAANFSRDGSLTQAYVRRLDGDKGFEMLAGQNKATVYGFSPDSRSVIARERDGALGLVSIADGTLSKPFDGVTSEFFHWGTADRVVHATQTKAFLTTLSTSTTVELPNFTGRDAFLLPDGSGVLGSREGSLTLLDLKSQTVTVLIAGGLHPVYVATGHVLYVTPDGALNALPFDLSTHAVTGPPVQVAAKVAFSQADRGFSVSANGTLVQRVGDPSGMFAANTLLIIMGTDGRVDTLPLPKGTRRAPRFSPDGGRLAFVEQQATSATLHVYDLASRTDAALTFSGTATSPVWSPDGTALAYASDSAGTSELRVRAATNAGNETVVRRAKTTMTLTGWTRDNQLLFAQRDSTGARDLLRMKAEAGATATPYLALPFDEQSLSVSPDGAFALFSTDESAAVRVWMREFPRPSGKWLVSPRSGDVPRWSADGKHAWYWVRATPLDTLLRVTVTAGPSPSVSPPQVMATIDASGVENWDLHPDGRRFVLAIPNRTVTAAGAVQAREQIVLRWFSVLSAKMSAKP
jgi:eukaryotic-like serine/threonine-protein kinase